MPSFEGLPTAVNRIVPDAGLKGLKSSLRNGAREFGGRDPDSAVIDISLGAIYGTTLSKIGLVHDDHAETACLTSDGVKPSVATLDGFPYLSPGDLIAALQRILAFAYLRWTLPLGTCERIESGSGSGVSLATTIGERRITWIICCYVARALMQLLTMTARAVRVALAVCRSSQLSSSG